MTNLQADAPLNQTILARWAVMGRLHASGSVAARVLRRWTGDPLQAEALHLLAGTLFALVCVGAYLLSGSLPASTSALAATWSIWIGIAGCLLGLFGWRSGMDVLLSGADLLIRQGGEEARIPFDTIVSCGALSARTFHRVHRRYAGVRTFIPRTDALLLIETTDGPIVLGLADRADRDALHDALSAHPSPTCASVRLALAA